MAICRRSRLLAYLTQVPASAPKAAEAECAVRIGSLDEYETQSICRTSDLTDSSTIFGTDNDTHDGIDVHENLNLSGSSGVHLGALDDLSHGVFHLVTGRRTTSAEVAAAESAMMPDWSPWRARTSERSWPMCGDSMSTKGWFL